MDEILTVENNDVNMEPQPKQKQTMSREKKRKIFYFCVVILPLIQFALFYVYVNVDMFLMAFRVYSFKTGEIGYNIRWTFTENFAEMFKILAMEKNRNLTGQTFLFYLMSLTYVPIGIMFAYYIYKNYMLSGFFRVMLYLPSIVSGIVMTMIFKYMLSWIFHTQMSLFYLILYSFLHGFGLNVVMYVSAMCSIDESISESCQLDGAGALREFWSVTVPMIFPTVVTFLVMGVAGIFTNQAGLYTFYGVNAANQGYQTFGYYMYIQSMASGLVLDSAGSGGSGTTAAHAQMTYPQLCALGVLITVVVMPLALGLRAFLEKYGPNEN